jgi:hypothetical protein
MYVILPTVKVEIKRFTVQSLLGNTISKTLSQKYPTHTNDKKKG